LNPRIEAIVTAQNRTRPVLDQVVSDARRAGQSIETANAGVARSMHAANTNVGNLAAQFNDIGVQLAGGQSPLLIAAQQGTQITQALGPIGAGAAVKQLGAAFFSLLSPLNLLTIGAIAVGGTVVQALFSMGREADKTASSLTSLAAPTESLAGKISDLKGIAEAYAKAISSTATSQDQATQSIIANSEREFNAKKQLLELEYARQQAAIATKRAELANKRDQVQGIAERITLPAPSDLRRNDPRPYPLNDPVDDMRRSAFLDLAGPVLDEIKKLNAELTLAEVGTERLAVGLGMSFSDTVTESIASMASETGELQKVIDPLWGRMQELSGVLEATHDPFEQMKLDLIDLKTLWDNGRISTEQFNEAVRRTTLNTASSTLGMVGQLTGAFAGLFEDNKAFAVANAVINTAEGVTKALAQGGMFGFASAAAVAAAGAAQIATIMSSKPGSSSTAAVSGAGGDASVTPTMQQSRVVNINLPASGYLPVEAFGSLVERINQELGIEGLKMVIEHRQG